MTHSYSPFIFASSIIYSSAKSYEIHSSTFPSIYYSNYYKDVYLTYCSSIEFKFYLDSSYYYSGIELTNH